MNRYPAKPMMDQMAQHGRYGDTMLVHMNPVEVAGIAALSPTGKLTTNPVTGQPEAFLPLLFGALGGALKLGTLGTAALSGIGTAAVTGDLKRGLLAGVTSGLTAGIGEAFADAGSAVDTVTSAADTAGAADAVRGTLDLTDATAQLPLGDLSSIDPGLIDPAGTMKGITQQLDATNQGLASIGAGPDSIASQLEQTKRLVASTAPVAGTPADPTISQQLFGEAENFVNRGIGSLGTSGQLVGAMTTEGVSQQMQTQQDFERQQAAMREKSEAKRRQAYDDLQGAYAAAQPFASPGYSPYRSMMSRNTPPPFVPGMQEGGVVKMFYGGNVPDFSRYQEWLAGPGAAYANSTNEEKGQAYFAWLGVNPGGTGNGNNSGSGDGSNDGTGNGTDNGNTTPDPISTVPSDEEVRVLNIAGRGDILGAENQLILEGYYNRLRLANQQANEADEAAEAEENRLYIPEGATNSEALQALRQANLIPTDAYNWLMRHYRESGTGDSQYFASEQFPGTEEWLASTDFNEENKNYLRQVLPLIQQGATTGIPLTGGEGSVEDIVAFNPFSQYYGGGANPGYGGLDPVTIQKNLRGGVSVAPPRDYMPGFEPEFRYFQEDPNRLDIPNRAFRPTARRYFNYGDDYFDPIMDEQEYLTQLQEYYTKLGGYGPDAVVYPEETASDDDDADNIGDGVDDQTPPGNTDSVSRAFVNTLYQELFGRDARDAGYEYWADQVARGKVSSEDLRAALIHSAMTGHPEDHPDRMYLTNYLYGDQDDDSTADDDAVLTRAALDALYQELFGRDARDPGYQYWLGQVESGAVSMDRLRDTLIHSAMTGHPEDHPDRIYLTRVLYGDQDEGDDVVIDDDDDDVPDAVTPGNGDDTTTTDDTPTYGAYGNPLAAYSSAERDDYIYRMLDVSGMGGNYTPEDGGTLSGQEQAAQRERARLVVRDMFNRYLGREPDQGALDYYSNQILRGNSPRVSARNFDRVVGEIMNSAEGQAYAAAVQAGTANIPERTAPGGNYTYTDIDAWMAGEPASMLPELDATPDAEGYYSAANARDVDPFLWSNRTSFYGEEVRADSRGEVSSEEFNNALTNQAGRYGGRMIFDPETGTIYEGITDEMSEADQNAFMRGLERAEERGAVPIGVDPKLLSPAQRMRAEAMYGSGNTVTRIGNTRYLVDENGNVVTYEVRDINYTSTPSFGTRSGGRTQLPVLKADPPRDLTRSGLDRLYQELFGRNAKDAGYEYWASSVESGAVSMDKLKDTLINAAMSHPDDHPDKVNLMKYLSGGRSRAMSAGGTVPLRTSMGDTEVSSGGIANVPTECTASMPSEQEFSMVAAAVLGRVENPDVIVDMFVEKYGPEMFQRVREYVLQNVAPNAQTEGMIRGKGSGMDDKVPGMIGDQQPVAVSPGEFIVPADVVSGLGDGSSDAGAKELDKMMDRVRMARGGTTKQAPSIDAGKMMPA